MNKRNTTAVCVSLVYVAVAAIIWLRVLGEIFNESLNYIEQNIGIILSQVIVLGGACLLYALISEPENSDNEDDKMVADRNTYLICIISSVILVLFMLVFKELIANIWFFLKGEVLFEHVAQNAPPATELDITQILITIISVGIVTPVFEEMYFRKVLIGGTSRVHPICLVIVSVLAFLLMHKNIEQIIYILPMAVYVSIMYMRACNVRYCIITHMIINIAGIFIKSKAFPVFSWQQAVLKNDKLFSLICIGGLLICGVLLLLALLYVNKLLKNKKNEACKRSIGQSAAYVIAGMLFGIFMFTRTYKEYNHNEYNHDEYVHAEYSYDEYILSKDM